MQRLAAVLILAVAALAPAQAALAQYALPYIPPERYQERRWLEGDKVTFCTWDVSPTRALEDRLAAEIGAVLLLDVEIFEFERTRPQADDDFWEQVLIQLYEHCDALMGFALVSSIVPDWLTPTRAYYEGPFVFAVTDPEVTRLGDVPAGSRIGSLLYSTADLRLIEYDSVRPEAERWKRLPFADVDQMLDFVERGTIAGALIWAPYLTGREGRFRAVPLDPIQAPPTPVGMVLLSQNSFLRGQLDLAIGSLIEDGIVAAALAELGLPASAR